MVNGRAISEAIDDMKESLQKAKNALDTEQGKKIAAAYLGYEDPSELTDIDINNIKKNIESLEGTGEWLKNNDMSVKRCRPTLKKERMLLPIIIQQTMKKKSAIKDIAGCVKV